MPTLTLDITTEHWPLAQPFHIAGHVIDAARVIHVTLSDGTHIGHGEACGVFYLGETPERMTAQLEAVRAMIEAGIDRAALLGILPCGGARNAVDAALWALESHQRRLPVVQLARLPPLRARTTTITLGVDTPAAMAAAARRMTAARALKVKLDGTPEDAARLAAIGAARPGVPLSVDANQGWSRAHFDAMLPTLQALGVTMLEQPFPVGEDACLETLACPIPIVADESFQDGDDLARVARRYDVVNLKLDKCGGLTRALQLVRLARQAGLVTMVGCMAGTSLATAPAFVLAQWCDHVDLDGPLLLARDRVPGATYSDGMLYCPEAVWGHADTPQP